MPATHPESALQDTVLSLVSVVFEACSTYATYTPHVRALLPISSRPRLNLAHSPSIITDTPAHQHHRQHPAFQLPQHPRRHLRTVSNCVDAATSAECTVISLLSGTASSDEFCIGMRSTTRRHGLQSKLHGRHRHSQTSSEVRLLLAMSTFIISQSGAAART